MIKGIGIDIIETERIGKSIESKGNRFLQRVFTEKEQCFCLERKKMSIQSFAVRFAAKEAVMKALGTGWAQGVGWHDIEIITTSSGKPEILLSGKAAHIAEESGITEVHISMSHTKSYCTAFAIAE